MSYPIFTSDMLNSMKHKLSCRRSGCVCGKSGGRNLTLHCPAHDDQHPSLSVTTSADDKVLFHCLAGCSQSDVIAALQTRGLWPCKETILPPHWEPNQQGNGETPRQIADTYDYLDENGDLLYQVVRYEPKDFRMRRPDGNGRWVYNMADTRRVLYRLPEVLAAIRADEPVFICEGEKDVEKWREVMGLPATCNPGGANKWSEDYSEALRGSTAYILPDNDKAGRDHAEMVAFSLYGLALTVKVLQLPGLPEKGDVSDWLRLNSN